MTASWLAQTDPALALNVPQPKKHLSPGQIRIVVPAKTDTTFLIFQNPEEAEKQDKYYTCMGGSYL